MIGFEAIAEAAKSLGDIQTKPLRVSCPSCGSFVFSLMVIPAFVRARCNPCRIDVVTLVDRDREILTTTTTKKS